jgi:hypothetical protein
MRRLPDGFDGNTCPYIFTWGEERPCKTWGMGSGCSAYYNTDKEGNANTKMVRYFDEDRFEIFATRKFSCLAHFIGIGERRIDVVCGLLTFPRPAHLLTIYKLQEILRKTKS